MTVPAQTLGTLGVWAQIPTVPITPTTVPDPAAVAAAAAADAAALEKACGVDPSWLCEQVYDKTGSASWSGVLEWFVSKPLSIILIVIVAIVANRILRRLIKRTTQRMLQPQSGRAKRARKALRSATPNLLLKTAEVNMRTEARVRTLTTVFRSLTTVFVWLVAFFAILNVLDVNLAPLLASAGVIGVALGFGAQNVVRDFLAGIFLVVEDQFGVGDIVDLGEAKGTVEEITLRATSVRDVHGTLWHVPNGQIMRVANKSQEWARAVLDIEVDASTDYDRAASVIQQVADGLAAERDWQFDVMGTPEVWGIEAFTTDGYTIRLVLKTRPASQFGVMRELRIRLRAAFAEHKVLFVSEDPESKQEIWLHDARASRGARAYRVEGRRDRSAADQGAEPASPAPPPPPGTTTSAGGLEVVGGATAAQAPGAPATVAPGGPQPAQSAAIPPPHPTRGDPSEG